MFASVHPDVLSSLAGNKDMTLTGIMSGKSIIGGRVHSGSGLRGTFSLFHVEQMPLPRSWYGRQNKRSLTFHGNVLCFVGSREESGTVQAKRPVSLENNYCEVQVRVSPSLCPLILRTIIVQY